MRRVVLLLLAVLVAMPLSAQTDKREVRRGNRKFGKQNYKEAELDYRRALVKDSTSFAGTYDLASALYRQKDFEGAGTVLAKTADAAAGSAYADRYYYNSGDIALQKKDYAAAVEAFRQSLLSNPGDLDAKENYIYAKKMLENQQNQDQQDQDDKNNNKQDQDDQQQNQQPKDQPQDQPEQQEQQEQPQEQKVSPQQAQQMLQAIQAKEKETQDKVEKAKALQAKTRQKEKNW